MFAKPYKILRPPVKDDDDGDIERIEVAFISIIGRESERVVIHSPWQRRPIKASLFNSSIENALIGMSQFLPH